MMETEVKKFAYWYIFNKIPDHRIVYQDNQYDEIPEHEFHDKICEFGDGIDYNLSEMPLITWDKRNIFCGVILYSGKRFHIKAELLRGYEAAVNHFRNTLLIEEYRSQ